MTIPFDIPGQIEAIVQAVDTAQREPGGPSGYRLRRIILANFWLYTLQVFEIPHGRLLLAGNNASGKSTVLTAALPLALEGSLRPERLDTFGGKHKHAEYYVLGDESSSTSFHHTKRTSYVALEFEWCQSDAEQVPDLAIFTSQEQRDTKRFFTIGISLYGNEAASTHIQPTYFLITDGSRLINDIELTSADRDGQLFVCPQPKFKENLKGHGILCDSQEKYAQEVSRRLFGFDDPRRFRKLIELLLVLRRPNPSDGLTVNTVQQYLTDALPAIPDEIAREAVETIGEIDNLQQQIEQFEQEHQAVSELHQAQQKLALSNARSVGYQYRNSQQRVEHLDKEIAHLHHELAALETKQHMAATSHEAMRTEKEQVAGRIAALETADVFRVAQQVVEAEHRVQSTQDQLQKQQKTVERAQARCQQNEESMASSKQLFRTKHENIEQLLRTLRLILEKKILWQDVAEQFQQSLEYINTIHTARPDTIEIIQQAASLTKIETEQRLKWLQNLDTLHREKQDLERAIERAQIDENRHAREVDRLLTQFKDILNDFFARSNNLEATLANSIMNGESNKREDEQSQLENLDTQETHLSFENIEEVDIYLTQCETQFQQHKQSIESILSLREKKLADLKEKIEKLQLEKVQLQGLLQTKKREYSQKAAQTEVTPEQPEHRQRARQRLAEQHIPAFPLYSLIDLVPTHEQEEAGYIESMLEDTGLLDALIILDEDIPLADKLLQEEGLSDYRVDHSQIEQSLLARSADLKIAQNGRWLCFDAAASDTLPAPTHKQWEATINTYIPLLEALYINSSPNTIQGDAALTWSWRHGLLTGQSARATVRFIGKATRQQARQQELARLTSEIHDLEYRLTVQTQLLAQRQRELEKFAQDQETLRNLLYTYEMPIKLDGAKQSGKNLKTHHAYFKEAQEQTRKKRQEYTQLTMRLTKQGGSLVVFAHEHEKVRIALHEMYKLGPQIHLLQEELAALQRLYQEVQEKQLLVQDAENEQNECASLLQLLEDQSAHDASMLDALRAIINAPEAKDLKRELAALRSRAKTLDETLLRIVSDISTFTERRKTLAETVVRREFDLQSAQADMRQKQMFFKEHLTTYPVPELEEANRLFEEGQYSEAVQPLQIDTSMPERLQQEQMQARSELETLYKTYMNMLHEYGPELDQKTALVTFSQRNGTTSVEMLDQLDNALRQQQELLKDEEIKLFESFLLRRMTEVLHKYIREAREWVDKMNEPLQTMSTVQDRYELEWQPKPRVDAAKLGSHLAKHQKLFNKPLSKLSEEEQERIKAAFKQEIEAIWRNDEQDGNTMNFEQRLQTIFDYRQWFQFRVYVTPKGGQRFQLSNKTLGTRSGAERLFDLLVPLLAAVTALYNHASEGAPRLLALDEAFDRASADNMQQFIEYLAGQGFQWIMTGPQLNISGSRVPASIRYLMLHEKGSKVATAVPKIWKSSLVKNM